MEKDTSTNKGKNNFAIVTPSSQIACTYTKIHPFSFGLESQFYIGGQKIFLTNIDDFCISPLICYDLRFPEIFQIASKEASLITVSANWPKSRRDHWITLLKARAIENQCYIAGVNRVGISDNIEYCGDSIIIDPLGNILNHIENKEILIIHDIDYNLVKNTRDKFNLKLDRKEDLYKQIQCIY